VDVLGCANSVTFIEFIEVASNIVVLIEFSWGQSALGSLDDFLTFPVSTQSHAIEESLQENVGVNSVWWVISPDIEVFFHGKELVNGS
jgi:hypothetical protein